MDKMIDRIVTLPDRNFYAGYPRNPATYVAESVEGEYYEGFVRDYATRADFERDAVRYFTRKSNAAAA